jgi:SAM-dependent methyltransferase
MSSWSLPSSREPELMDDPALAAGDHVAALGALATINAVSRTAACLTRSVVAMRPPHGAAFTVVDVACGGGDVTSALERRLARAVAAARPQVVGIDISPRAIDRARRTAEKNRSGAAFHVHDVLQAGCPPCDVAVSSLFLHHLDDSAAVGLLRSMAQSARVGVVISDLIRSRLGLALAVIGTTVLTSSRVARVDGPLSVRAARTIPEYHGLLARAGLSAAVVRRTWPERVLIAWRRAAAAEGSA